MFCPSLDLFSEDHRELLNRWLPKNVKFYRCLSKSLSAVKFVSFTWKKQQQNSIFNCVEYNFMSKSDTLLWNVTIYINTRLVVGFPCLYGVEADLVLCLLLFSPPFGVIAEARWGGRVRNNLLALHSYFQHRDGAINSRMDLALLPGLWFLRELFLLNCHEGTSHFVMRCEPCSIWMYFRCWKETRAARVLLIFWLEKLEIPSKAVFLEESVSLASFMLKGTVGRHANICG